jgi:hypothetical protein
LGSSSGTELVKRESSVGRIHIGETTGEAKRRSPSTPARKSRSRIESAAEIV